MYTCIAKVKCDGILSGVTGVILHARQMTTVKVGGISVPYAPAGHEIGQVNTQMMLRVLTLIIC